MFFYDFFSVLQKTYGFQMYSGDRDKNIDFKWVTCEKEQNRIGYWSSSQQRNCSLSLQIKNQASVAGVLPVALNFLFLFVYYKAASLMAQCCFCRLSAFTCQLD